MDIVEVVTGERRYEIHIAAGVLGQLPALCSQAALKAGKTLVVTDENVRPLYGEAVKNVLEAAGWQVRLAVVPAGESAKTFAWAQRLYDEALLAGIDRKRPIMALGGGVVGDLAGFVAATFLRGVPFVQLPTTLLAQVDSSVGGKVAVNHPQGKNLIGAFYQPHLVAADVATLDTLPEREWAGGLAEVVKYGAIFDASFLEWLEKHAEALRQKSCAEIEYVIGVCCRHKAAIVAEDEKETGRRALLNFGHTMGHALESATGFAQYIHGEAVAIGMIGAAYLGELCGVTAPGTCERLERILKAIALPIRSTVCSAEQLAPLLMHDKKVAEGTLHWVLLQEAGTALVTKQVTEADVLAALCYICGK
ncbi:MAG: 3-dehydroquinate synthase [Anaeromusa sp.]|uniref:3-dehydroquinate synthase n=2 Tax=Anaeromusa sp. TaxID=1872520 RepID=UPI002B20EEA4|nr:3-dehydroquinate synthase [Anaeromusa sp.]MEA4834415.1 3-dehydroquinate synthase [Anaeromusa sp.]NCB76496.1 3-dehydroquinate synthase [Negativicutes bacterium]